MTALVVARKLDARYGSSQALTDISFELREGEILVILGPNGSGKTTLFRVLLGLLPPHAGTIDVFGGAPGLPTTLLRIGATIEIPSLYGHLSALENLEVTAHLKLPGGANRADLELLLDDVGLANTKQTVATYSLGMRQRLAIAEALVGKPRLLILDEPTNGLDPEGIRWFREWVVQAVTKRGLTVITSSHILTEVTQFASRLLVLKNGRERFSGTVADLGGKRGTRVRTRDLDLGQKLLVDGGFDCTRHGDDLHLDALPERMPEVARVLVGGGADVLELGPLEQSLEDRYLSLIGERA